MSTFVAAYASGSKSSPSPAQGPISQAPGATESIEFPNTSAIYNIEGGLVPILPVSGSPSSNYFRAVYAGVYSILFTVGPSTADQGTVVLEFIKNDAVFSTLNVPVRRATAGTTSIGTYITEEFIVELEEGDVVYSQSRNVSSSVTATGLQYNPPKGIINKSFTITRIL